MRASYIDKDTLQRLRDSAKHNAWLPLWVSVETGLRVGDVVSLRWEQIRRGGISYTAEKTKKDGHALISAGLYNALMDTYTGGTEWVFPSPKDPQKHIRRETVWHRVKAACARCGVDPAGISPHTMRKVFAVELFKRAGLKAAQVALQHDRASTTELYALSDFSTGSNARLPLTRGDIPLIVELCVAALKNRA